MDALLGICLGIGLAAACGFRVFVPLLVMSIAALSGHLTLSPSFQWIASYPALVSFIIATILEICGYYIPWVDNILDTIAAPAAVVAGTIVTAASVTEMSPYLQWTLAVIAGGGVAATVQGFTSVTRAASTLTTGGMANPLLSTAEAGGSVLLSTLSVTVPVLAVLLVVTILVFALRKIWKRNPVKSETMA